MFKRTMIANALTTALIASSLAVPAYAADNAANTEKVDKEKVERIEVTGSRIKRIGSMSPTPITVITGADLTNAGITNVADLLHKLPSSTVGISPETSNNFIFANGLNLTSLRGLGSDRTLVLVNGRRFVPGTSDGGAVDLNSIPTAMVERMEVITGGASAVYGSDAIAGVVNIITRKSTDGVEVDLSYTQPEQSGGESSQFSLTYGSDFADDKGSFIFNVTRNQDKQLRDSDRDFLANRVYGIYNPDYTDGSDGITQRYAWEGVRKLNWLNYAGVFFGGAEGRYTFDDQGNLKPFDFGDGPVTSHPREGNYCTGPCDGWNPVDTSVSRTPVDRLVFTFSSEYNLNDDHRIFTEFTHANSEAHGESTPVFHRGVNIKAENPFIRDDLRKVMADANMDSLGLYRLSTEFGNRKYNQDRTTLRYVLGVEGSISDDWGYNLYYQKGELKSDTLWSGQIINANWEQALDAVRDADGNIVCRDQSNGCQPLNILGRNMASQAALDFVGTTAGRSSEYAQEVVSLLVDGRVFDMPAGEVAVALSAEHRKESGETNPDMALTRGLIFGNESLAMAGEYDVTEFALETSIPLLTDMTMVKDLSMDLAYRFMDYSQAGEHDAWKVGFNWDVVEDLKVRATRSRSVRAPNIGELFSPKGQTFETIVDVCRESDINEGSYPENRVKNCRAAGIPEGWSPTANWDRGNRPGYNQGNQDLQPEISDDYTLGFVYTPSQIEGLSLTVDYWSFDIKDAINSLDVSDAVRYCYDSVSPDNTFCKQFSRGANLDIETFVQQSVNMASYETSGTDIEANYEFGTTEYGDFRVNVIATYLEQFEFNSTGFAEDIDNDVGEYTDPRWKARMTMGWTYGDLYLQALAKYRHSAVSDNDHTETPESRDYINIPSHTTWDLSGTYQYNEDLQVRFGVLNALDKAPARNPFVYDGGGYYDIDGRSFFLGMNYKY